jgi:uncharacterized membrane protein
VVITFLLQLSYNLILLQVIWVIGWSMVLFSAAIRLPRKVTGVLAFLIIAGHNMIPDSATTDPPGVLAGLFLHSPFLIQVPGIPPVLVAYTILPWFGIMLAGYFIGPWLQLPSDKAAGRFLRTGAAMIAVFVVIRFINSYGDPAPWSAQPRGFTYSLLSFVNVTKYPPSLQFTLLMIGIGLLLLALFTRVRGRITDWLHVFGQVPFFYYILHLVLISACAYVWTTVAFGRYVNVGFTPASDWPAAYEPSLLRVVAVWLFVVIVLYFPCRWFANYRRGHKSRWLSYV